MKKTTAPNAPMSRAQRLRRWAARSWYIIAFGFSAMLALSLGLTLWLLSTEAGLRNALAVARQFTGGALTVEQVEGRLLTPMHLSGVRYRSGGLEVEVDEVDLAMDLSQILRLNVVVRTLETSGVRVKLAPPKPEEPEPEPGQPPELRLPLGVFVGKVSIDDLAIRSAEDTELFALEHGDLSGHWNRDDIRIDTLQLVHEEYGEIGLSAQATALADGVLIDALDVTGPGRLSLAGRVGLSAQADNDLNLKWDDLHWPPQGDPSITSPDGRLSVQGTWTALSFDADAGIGPQARITAQGDWSPDNIDAHLAWTDLADFKNPSQSIWRSRRGRLDVTGVPEDYRFELNGELVARELPGKIAGEGQGNLQGLHLQRFVLEALQGSLTAKGDVAWNPEVSAQLSLRARKLDPSAILAGWAGSINGDVDFSLAMPQQQPDARFTVAIDDSVLRDRPLSLQAQGRYSGDALNLQQVELHSGRTTLTASGRATAPFDLKADLDSPNLEALWPGLGGRASLQASLQGELPIPGLQLRGQFDDVAYQAYRLASASIDAEVYPQQPMTVRLDARGIDVGESIDSLGLTLDGPLADHRLQLDVLTERGTVSMAMAGGYQPQAQRWDGNLQALSVAPGKAPPWTLQAPAPLTLSAREAGIERACLGGDGGEACLSANYTPDATQASVDLSRFALEYLRPLLPEDYAFRGELSGQADVALAGSTLRSANVDLKTTELRLRVGATLLQLQPSTLIAHENEQGLDVDTRINLSEGSIILQAHAQPGEVLAQRALEGRLAINIPDMGVLERASPEIGEAKGVLNGAFDLGGTLGLPAVNGKLAVDDGSIRLETPGIVLSNLQADVRGTSTGQVQLAVSAESGKGTLEIGGDIDFAAKPLVADIHIGGDRFQAANTPVAKVWIDPDLNVRLGAKGLDIRGSVGVPQALVTPERFKGGGASSPSSDQIILEGDGSEPEPALPIRAEVTVKLGEKVRFEGYGLESRFSGSLTVIEQPGKLTSARGQISMVDGKYQAYGQDLTIETGRLIYSGGPVVDPALQLRASRQPRDNITVGVIVRGTLGQPQFSLYSDPSSMTQQEQLSWLVLGRGLSSGGSDDAALANAALSLGLKGGQWFAEKIGGGIGLDDLSVGSEPGQTADQAQLTIGKYLSPKLYVSYGVSLFQPGHTFKLRYDLGKGFSVETESGVYSGGDLLYSIEK
ncbi:translocation/assembly module TamB domain-containing protein [Algiphilus sp. W345]|uniref:Translocation/assembly module TamB domain-containing protein n=1 Tax=Banduia mediterranea TaxID=3075609 RepID=A0ABU2WDB0_9GAMM|nr:translocation/assembly module TamB domain-containing protein [Algiphilus sp. W345]MDT0495866.1 translocation/assembly module TamB domain-containing protein [Algiphilus sp. W345]